MPCHVDPPSRTEEHRLALLEIMTDHEVRRLVVNYVADKNDLLYSKYISPEYRSAVDSDSKNCFCSSNREAELCDLIRILPEPLKQRIIFAQNPKARKLANWWEEHQLADAARLKAEEKKKEKELFSNLDKLLKGLSPSQLNKVRDYVATRIEELK